MKLEKLHFERRVRYGRERFYPKCPTSSGILSLAKKKSLTRDEVEALERAGFEIETVQEGAT